MRYLSFFLLLCLFSCDSNRVRLVDACDTLSAMCMNLSVDSRCFSLRRDVITQAYIVQKKYTVKGRYTQMITLEEYVDCTEQSTWIEFKNPKDNIVPKIVDGKIITLTKDKLERIKEHIARQKRDKQKRIETFSYAKSLLNELDELTRNKKEPYLLYWHWLRNGSLDAFAQLKKLDDINRIKDHELIYFLSQKYIRHDMNRGIAKMLSSLALYPEEDYIKKPRYKKGVKATIKRNEYLHVEIFKSLAAIYFKNKEYEKSYIFAKLMELNNDNAADHKMIVERFSNKSKHLVSGLNKRAEALHDKLKEGKFNKNCQDFPKNCIAI